MSDASVLLCCEWKIFDWGTTFNGDSGWNWPDWIKFSSELGRKNQQIQSVFGERKKNIKFWKHSQLLCSIEEKKGDSEPIWAKQRKKWVELRVHGLWRR